MLSLDLENKYWSQGYENVAGIDEVGRGCLAGDVVACSIIMPKGLIIEGVKDSKKLSPKKRETLYDDILNQAIAIGIGRVGPEDIDRFNIKNATIEAMKRSVKNLKTREGESLSPDYLLVDAERLNIGIMEESVIKGDDLSHTIACASIVAKVYRDNLCKSWDEDYPGYNLSQHKGYGTKAHIEKILEIGPSKIHRMSFLTKILNKE